MIHSQIMLRHRESDNTTLPDAIRMKDFVRAMVHYRPWRLSIFFPTKDIKDTRQDTLACHFFPTHCVSNFFLAILKLSRKKWTNLSTQNFFTPTPKKYHCYYDTLIPPQCVDNVFPGYCTSLWVADRQQCRFNGCQCKWHMRMLASVSLTIRKQRRNSFYHL